MLQELAAGSDGSAWTIGSMLFFLVVYVAVALRAFRSRADDLDARARLPLDDNDKKA